MNAFDRALKVAGGPTNLAEAIGVSRQFIHQLQTGRRPIPPRLCVEIERATGVKRAHLRPDIFGPVAA
jgi:DNA-binding transcriptional regulator YdaS (Cro superfamily)